MVKIVKSDRLIKENNKLKIVSLDLSTAIRYGASSIILIGYLYIKVEKVIWMGQRVNWIPGNAEY